MCDGVFSLHLKEIAWNAAAATRCTPLSFFVLFLHFIWQVHQLSSATYLFGFVFAWMRLAFAVDVSLHLDGIARQTSMNR